MKDLVKRLEEAHDAVWSVLYEHCDETAALAIAMLIVGEAVELLQELQADAEPNRKELRLVAREHDLMQGLASLDFARLARLDENQAMAEADLAETMMNFLEVL